MVEPTSVEETILILNQIKDKYEDHHNVTYTDEAIAACVNLTSRYITDRFFQTKRLMRWTKRVLECISKI